MQLRRFYGIDSARRPYLASQCLALSLRTLGGEFETLHGFQPLLAESFHDPDEHTGTHLDEDISSFPGSRLLIRSTREWSGNKSDELKSETRYFITSLWKEDTSRPRKKASGGQVLALSRGAVLRLHDGEVFASLNAGFHHHSAQPHAGLRLLKTSPPKIN